MIPIPSVDVVITNSGNGVVPVQILAFAWNNADLWFEKFEQQYNHFLLH